jgi:hypothetical protein
MNSDAASAFLVVLGIDQAQAHSHPEAFVLTTGAWA